MNAREFSRNVRCTFFTQIVEKVVYSSIMSTESLLRAKIYITPSVLNGKGSLKICGLHGIILFVSILFLSSYLFKTFRKIYLSSALSLKDLLSNIYIFYEGR